MVKSLAVTLGETTTRVEVVSEKPTRWSIKGTDSQVPCDVLRYLFEQARAAGVRESRIMAPRLATYDEDGAPCEVPLAYRAWCIYAR